MAAQETNAGMVIWLVGLSGSGKTTLGRAVAEAWRKKEPNTVLLDGDELRDVFKAGKGTQPFTIEGWRGSSKGLDRRVTQWQ